MDSPGPQSPNPPATPRPAPSLSLGDPTPRPATGFGAVVQPVHPTTPQAPAHTPPPPASNTHPSPRHSGGKGILILLLLIFMIGTGVFAYLWQQSTSTPVATPSTTPTPNLSPVAQEIDGKYIFSSTADKSVSLAFGLKATTAYRGQIAAATTSTQPYIYNNLVLPTLFTLNLADGYKGNDAKGHHIGELYIVKYLFYGIAYISFGFWLVPLRDWFSYHQWRWPTAVANNVPNALSVLRGVVSLPVVVGFMIALWEREQTTAQWYFLVIIGLFLLDAIDGPLARMLDYMTDFGKEVDPLADKVLVYSMALGLPVITWHYQGYAAAGFVLFCLVWMGFIEQRVVRTTLRARSLSRLTNVKMHGAFGAGKIKFVFQAAGFAIGYGFLIWLPESRVSGYLAGSCFIVARVYADRSLGEHRREADMLRKEALRGGFYEREEAA